MTLHKFSIEQEAEIVARYKAGEGAITLAHVFGCGDKPISRVLRLHGAYEPGRRFVGRYTGEQKREMVERYQAGESLGQIGQRFGCTIGNVRQILDRRGVPRRRAGSPPVDADILERVRARREEGASQQQIADELGVSQVRVSKWLRRDLGFPPERNGSGPTHVAWRGGRTVTPTGYVYVWIAPDDQFAAMRDGRGYVLEHRLLVARSIDRPLSPKETVHHIDGDHGNNRLENLQLRNGQHGQGVRLACLDCGSHNVGAVPLD